MSKRKYAHIKVQEELVISMRESGMTRQEMADELGLDKIQVKNCVYRYNHRRMLLALGHEFRPKDRPRKDGQSPKKDLQKEVERRVWKASCCGFFCSLWKGCEAKAKVCSNL